MTSPAARAFTTFSIQRSSSKRLAAITLCSICSPAVIRLSWPPSVQSRDLALTEKGFALYIAKYTGIPTSEIGSRKLVAVVVHG